MSMIPVFDTLPNLFQISTTSSKHSRACNINEQSMFNAKGFLKSKIDDN
ncbi:3120_t:CDS:2 [Gigaspora margarita]|uniref:3120_t:CDS:1 n=1 Tax=Gigaspora margarita TaxID=4874 RepID=A0ABM8W301_GIGMA|nr:3120_t:CDS:2 [Gigaspora margarita]